MKAKTLLGTITTAEGKKFPVYTLSRSEAMATFRPYGAALGQLAFSWNTLHDALSGIFKFVVLSPNIKIPSAIWFSSDSDFAQRKMLREALQVADHLPKKQSDDLMWLLNKIDESLRHKRNDVIHVPVSITRGVLNDKLRAWVTANMQSDNPRAKRFFTNGANRAGPGNLHRTISGISA